MEKVDGGKFTYQKMVKGGQIYNFYLFIDGVMTTDPSVKKTSIGKANWIFVPLSQRNTEKAASIFKQPLSFRMLKLKKLYDEI
jgi:hypothetical protein